MICIFNSLGISTVSFPLASFEWFCFYLGIKTYFTLLLVLWSAHCYNVCCFFKKKEIKLPVISSFWLQFIGLTAKVIDRTKTMADVYGAFFDFASLLECKVWSIRTPKYSMLRFVTKEWDAIRVSHLKMVLF